MTVFGNHLTVTVHKDVLLAIIEKNRSKHIAAFEAADAKYREKRLSEVEAWLVDAKAGKDFPRFTNLSQPISHVDDYDRAIEMVQMCVTFTLAMDTDTYRNYVKDEWHWKPDFAMSVNEYGVPA